MTERAAGRMVGVVGPSGVGKDSVMRGLAALDPNYRLVRRVITRAPELTGEAFEPVDLAEFEARQARGAFCLSWEAHGLHYGIPESVRFEAGGGTTLLVNLSRSVLLKAARVLPGFAVLSITAAPETLARRLATRGREARDDITARLARTVPLPDNSLTVFSVSNDGPLEATIAAAHAALAARTPAHPPPGAHVTG